MTEREALKLALDALENHTAIKHPQQIHYRDKAITAIKEALAQQCVCGEPNSAGTHRTDGPCLAPQRTWVGLTDDEFEDIELGCRSTPFGKIEAMRMVEAKLKEKNS